MTRRFETPGPVSLRVENAAGNVEISVHDENTTEVDLRALAPEAEEQVTRSVVECVEESGTHRVTITVPSRRLALWHGSSGVEVLVRLPQGAHLDVMTASADISASGAYAGGSIQTASGDVQWDEALGDIKVASLSGDISIRRAHAGPELRSARGDVSVHRASGPVLIETQSGDIQVDALTSGGTMRSSSGDVEVETAAGDLEITTSSGDVTVREADGDCRIQSRSGDVELAAVRQGTIRLETSSGDVAVGIASGSRVSVDATSRSGDLDSDIPLSPDSGPEEVAEGGPLVTLHVRTMSGDVEISRAGRMSGFVG